MKKLLGLAPLALLLCVGPGLAADPTNVAATPGDKIQIGTGVICDTHDEVNRFVNLMAERDAGVALHSVNQEASNPLACGMATVAFRTGADLGEVRTGKGAYKILKIEVIAGTADGKWHVLTPRRTQFTAIAVEGLDI